MTNMKAPIQLEAVKKRAEKKLSNQLASKESHPFMTGNIVKPVHIGKNEPLVKKILGLQ